MTLKARYEQRQISGLRRQGNLILQCVSNDGVLLNGENAPWDGYDPVVWQVGEADPDTLCWQITPPSEGEYHYQLILEQPERRDIIAEWSLYALQDDLLPLIPLRGDMHIHTSWSECGNRNEDPRYVAAWARKRGLDFVAITDHAQREPSLLAAEFIRNTGSSFRIYPGEETHQLMEKQPTLFCRNRFLPYNHIVGFGARDGVVKWANEHFDEYWQDIEDRAAALPDHHPRSIRLAMAGADWLIDKIHEFGGLAIFCHPFWRPCNRHNLPAPVREYILQQNKFDAMEVIGLCSATHNHAEIEGNRLAVAWWQQQSIRRGSMIPLVGNTDSHATRAMIGRHYTLVFAESNTLPSIQSAIRAGRSVACIRFPKYPLDIFGDFRLVSYAYFLEREYFPEHDAHCAAEGERLLAELQPASPLHG